MPRDGLRGAGLPEGGLPWAVCPGLFVRGCLRFGEVTDSEPHRDRFGMEGVESSSARLYSS